MYLSSSSQAVCDYTTVLLLLLFPFLGMSILPVYLVNCYLFFKKLLKPLLSLTTTLLDQEGLLFPSLCHSCSQHTLLSLHFLYCVAIVCVYLFVYLLNKMMSSLWAGTMSDLPLYTQHLAQDLIHSSL